VTAAQSAEADRLADAVEHARTAWHAARNHRDDAWRQAQDAVRLEVLAAEDYARAVAAYEAAKGWRS
jgi:hypothetical protein